MISVIVYGRNDNYGYNLQRRAAISLNAIAEVLSDDGDEIVFADFNTSDDMPTFVEAIADTLTPRAKARIRVLRIRPALAETMRRGSRLEVIEPAARNIALRRVRPANRWILSTNPDMIFVPRVEGQSLSDAVRKLPDGFYELPRFEIPEPLWESLDRMDPRAAIRRLAEWGKRLHLNEVVIRHSAIRYDAPGDFQLILKDQLYEIDGFDERMVHGWHVDSNVARRLWILNGNTASFVDHYFGYHCDHTLQSGVMHASGVGENRFERFFDDVTEPGIPEQRDRWGIPDQEIEEIRIDGSPTDFELSLETLVPGMREDTVSTTLAKETANRRVLYDNDHAFPYLAAHFASIPPETTVGYVGNNVELVDRLVRFLSARGFKGRVLAAEEMLPFFTNDEGFHSRVEITSSGDLEENADLFLFDAGMQHFGLDTSDPDFPFSSPATRAWRATFVRTLNDVVWKEHRRIHVNGERCRKFLLLAAVETWFQRTSQYLIGTVRVPFAAHVRHGFIKSRPRFFKAERRARGKNRIRYRSVATWRGMASWFRFRFLPAR